MLQGEGVLPFGWCYTHAKKRNTNHCNCITEYPYVTYVCGVRISNLLVFVHQYVGSGYWLFNLEFLGEQGLKSIGRSCHPSLQIFFKAGGWGLLAPFVAMPFVTSSILVPSSKARSP